MKRIDTLTGLRGLSALWVILYHYNLNPLFGYLNNNFIEAIILKGYLGVDIFFILSGFVISYVHLKDFIIPTNQNLFRFLGLRLARIMPIQWAMLLVFLVFYILGAKVFHFSAHDERFTKIEFLLNIFNLQDWGFINSVSWNAPSWSLSAEWFAYLMFPLTARLFIRFSKPLYNLLAWFGLITLLYGFCSFIHTSTISWTHTFGLIRVIIGFTVGCCLYNLYRANWMQNLPWDILSFFLFITGVIAINDDIGDVAIFSIFSLFLYALVHAKSWFAYFWNLRIMQYLGAISFSMYMVHWIFILIFKRIALLLMKHTPASQWTNLSWFLAFALLGCCILTAHFAYHIIEDPCRRKIRDWVEGKRAFKLAATPESI